MKKEATILFIAALIASLLGGLALADGPGSPLRKKARYYFVEGLRKQVEGDEASAYEYFRKAYDIDPSYKEAGSAYGMQRLMVNNDSLRTAAQLGNSLSMIRDFVDAYPRDRDEAFYYAFVSARLDSLDESIRIFERIDSLDPGQTVTLIHLSDVYMASGKPDKAIGALERYEKAEGKSPQLSMKKIQFMLNSGDTAAAGKEVDDLVASNLAEPTFRLIKGNFYQVIGLPDSVEKYYLEAERLAPESGEVKVALANLYRSRGDSVRYDGKIYEALLSEDFDPKDKVGILEEYIQTLFNDKSDTQRGDTLFQVLMKQYPHDPGVLDLAGRYSAAKGDLRDAIDQMGYAVDLNPEDLNSWGRLMSYQISDDKYDDAIATYDRSLEYITPPEGMTMLKASAASLAERYDLAEQTYSELIHKVNPDLPLTDSISDRKLLSHLKYEDLYRVSVYYNMLGDMYYNAKRLDKAYAAYENSLFFFPENAATLNNYAYFLSENKGDLEKAYEMSRKAIEQVPDNETYLDTYAWVLFRRGEYKDAREYQEKAVKLAEERKQPGADLYEHYGDILFMNHEPQEALEYWKKALELDPGKDLLQKKVKNKTFFFE